MGKTKILICQEHMYVGGEEVALINLLNRFDAELYDVDLLLYDNQGAFYDRIPKHINILQLPNVELLGFSTKQAIIYELKHFRLISAFKILCSRFRKPNNPHIYDFCIKRFPKLKYDAAINYSTWSNAFTLFLDQCVEAKVKVLFLHFEPVLKNHKPGQFPIQGLEKILKHYSDIIGVSQQVSESFARLLPEFAEKCSTVYNFMDEDNMRSRATEFSPQELQGDFLKILSVGRFVAQKNFTVIPEVCEILIKLGIDFKWFIIGDGEQKELTQAMIDEKGLGNKLFLLGTKTNPYPYFATCDLYCQPSVSEAYCTTINEARIFNKIIVATDFPGIREQLADGLGGVIVERNAQSIANGISKVVYMKDKEKSQILSFSQYPNEREQESGKRLFEILGNINE